MRQFILTLFLSVAVLVSTAQSGDKALDSRLAEYVKLNESLDFNKLIDYVHPKLFTLVTKDQLIESLRKTFENDEMKISIDTMAITTVGPAFEHAGVAYRQIGYSLAMNLRFTDTSNLADPEFISIMTTSFENAFPGGKVTFDKAKSSFYISTAQTMTAVKEKEKPWVFVGNEKNQVIVETLFPKEVIEKFSLL